MEKWWEQPVSALKGVGPKRAEAFARLEITTIGDLLNFYPRPDSYIDYSQMCIRDRLNEERYARRVFELWRNKRIYGRLHLQAELAKKQVADTYISLFLQEFTDTEEEEHVLAACDMLCKRHDAKYDVTTEKGVAAFVRYLTARGFGTRMIRIALEKAKATLLE